MNYPRFFVVAGCFLLLAGSAFAQDSLLGKNKGGGGTSSPPPRQSGSRGSSDHHRGSNAGSDSGSNNNSDNGDQSRGSNPRFSAPQDPSQKTKSRSGKVHYGTSNNLDKGDGKNSAPINIAAVHTDAANGSISMRDRIRRDDRTKVHHQDGGNKDRSGDDNGIGFRVGYYQYNRNFRDDSFCYPHYVFDPYTVDNCYVSPWYYYSFLPGYVDADRVINTGRFSDYFIGDPYYYTPPSRDGRYDNGNDNDSRDSDNYVRRHPLDYAIDDIIGAFLNDDRAAVDRLVSRTGSVAIGIDHRMNYSVRSDDFYDMLIDAVNNSRTVSYDILSVRSTDEEAEVIARHEYVDPWGFNEVMYHRYQLYGESGHIVIRSFDTNTTAFF